MEYDLLMLRRTMKFLIRPEEEEKLDESGYVQKWGSSSCPHWLGNLHKNQLTLFYLGILTAQP